MKVTAFGASPLLTAACKKLSILFKRSAENPAAWALAAVINFWGWLCEKEGNVSHPQAANRSNSFFIRVTFSTTRNILLFQHFIYEVIEIRFKLFVMFAGTGA